MTTNDASGANAVLGPASGPDAALAVDVALEAENGAASARARQARVVRAIFVTALLLGLLGDLLLNAPLLGINVTLWVAALVGAAVLLARRQALRLSGGGRWLALPALLFAACFAWRDSPVLLGLNMLAIMTALGLAAWRARSGQLREAGVLEYLYGLIMAGLHALLGGGSVLRDVPWRQILLSGRSRHAAAVTRGLLLALPLLLIFGALFASADAVFAELLDGLVRWDMGSILSHLFWIGLWAWFTAGLLRQTFVAENRLPEAAGRPDFLTLGGIELVIVLGALNALFLAFVLVQIRYLFGGAEVVLASESLTYAQYARRGFFELVTVAFLVLPLLLAADWALRRERPGDERLFRILAALLIVLLFVIMASALERMRLYTEVFGLTELRLYTTVFMGWLALVFLWFLATVLHGRRERFAYGALAAAFAVLAFLNALNPDALIVRTNLGRAVAAEPFDARYASNLSGDAIPLLIEALPDMAERDRCYLAARILQEWGHRTWQSDWRVWNLSRWQAAAAVNAGEAELRRQACQLR